jgi:segregation and condensation protein A
MVEIKVDGFSGPLDLLLNLIERKEMDITTLSLVEVTDQYWQEIESDQEIPPDSLADFIGIGSRLMYLKSCAILPSASPAAGDQEKPGDVAVELSSMLEEYRRIKDAAELFRRLEEEGRRTYGRAAPDKGIPMPPGLEGITLDTLMDAVKEALDRKPLEPEQGVIEIEPVTVDEKVAEITNAIRRRRGRLRFRPLLASCGTRTEIVVLFLAVLELIKAGSLWAEQDRPFGAITLVETAVEPA